ncbi:hypothetical protein Franean1_0460 [Parafrankia sp. EAN1pec]|nr:hypothetical protein Franean1_0460 [Frankia sp. EAN1pec]
MTSIEAPWKKDSRPGENVRSDFMCLFSCIGSIQGVSAVCSPALIYRRPDVPPGFRRTRWLGRHRHAGARRAQGHPKWVFDLS